MTGLLCVAGGRARSAPCASLRVPLAVCGHPRPELSWHTLLGQANLRCWDAAGAAAAEQLATAAPGSDAGTLEVLTARLATAKAAVAAEERQRSYLQTEKVCRHEGRLQSSCLYCSNSVDLQSSLETEAFSTSLRYLRHPGWASELVLARTPPCGPLLRTPDLTRSPCRPGDGAPAVGRDAGEAGLRGGGGVRPRGGDGESRGPPRHGAQGDQSGSHLRVQARSEHTVRLSIFCTVVNSSVASRGLFSTGQDVTIPACAVSQITRHHKCIGDTTYIYLWAGWSSVHLCMITATPLPEQSADPDGCPR